MPRDSSNNKSRLRHDESENGGLRMENAVFGSPSWTNLAQDGRGMMTRSSLTQILIIAAAFIGGAIVGRGFLAKQSGPTSKVSETMVDTHPSTSAAPMVE